MDSKRLHLIGNAHIDPVWLWRWPEGFAEIKATFQSALDRMEEFPDYRFTSACACYYEWVERNEPAMFEKIRARVAEGRWSLAGGWYIQPDCNLPCGESFARQALYSQRYFLDRFGVLASTGYNVDSFGHSAMLPQLLVKSGMCSYVYMRPAPHEQELPANLFRWESPDGSAVTAFRIPDSYATTPEEEARLRALRERARAEGFDYMGFYGVGNHGGGAAVRELELIGKLTAEEPLGFVHSTPDDYFSSVDAASLPVFRGDLHHHARGCYSAGSRIKANNRRAELLLLSAEKLCGAASLLFGLPYPRRALSRAWKDVLFNQFHDILGGCCLEEACEDADRLAGEAMSIAERKLNSALQKISWSIDTTCELEIAASKEKDWRLWEDAHLGTPVVLFNPLSWEVSADIRCGHQATYVTDEAGNPVPFQQVRASHVNGAHKLETLFPVRVPALGYTVYRIFKHAPAPSDAVFPALPASGLTMENAYLKVAIDPQTGGIASLYDKRTGRQVFSGTAAAGQVLDETGCDTWAHDVPSFHTLCGAFGSARVRLVEQGPVRTVIRTEAVYGQSVLRQDYSLRRDDPQLDVRVQLDWREKNKLLKLAFPVAAADPHITAEIPYGFVSRAADGGEEPCQTWVDLSDGAAPLGLGLINDCKYGYDACGHVLRLTAVRSPAYANHFGEEDEDCEYMDQGIQRFSYALLPHSGDFRSAGLVRRAHAFNCKPQQIVETFHKGPLPCTLSALDISCSHVEAPAFKEAEDGNGYILRCCETHGEPARADIRLPLLHAAWQAEFAPFEIKTFYLPKGGGPVTETDLLEFPLPGTASALAK